MCPPCRWFVGKMDPASKMAEFAENVSDVRWFDDAIPLLDCVDKQLVVIFVTRSCAKNR